MKKAETMHTFIIFPLHGTLTASFNICHSETPGDNFIDVRQGCIEETVVDGLV